MRYLVPRGHPLHPALRVPTVLRELGSRDPSEGEERLLHVRCERLGQNISRGAGLDQKNAGVQPELADFSEGRLQPPLDPAE